MTHRRDFMNLTLKQMLLFAIVLSSLLGCESYTNITSKLDGKADATFWFWARLQRIQYRENEQLTGLNEINLSLAKGFDVDGTSKGVANLASKHSHIVQQLNSMNTEKVDRIAVDYRNRLVAAHEALKEEWTKAAAAMMERDMQTLEKREALEAELIQYVNLWNDRYTVMNDLKSKYNRDFDVVE